MSQQSTRSDRLYNEDIAPRQETGNWKAWDLLAWWMSAWHSLGGYTMAVGLLVLGINGWQIVLGMVLGLVIIYFVSNLMGIAGQRVGVPFPVFSRISFGIYGANIAAILRAIVAVAWYGIQTYLASVAVKILIIKMAPGANSNALTNSGFLGLDALGWICFLALWAVQLAVLWRGMEAIRKLSDFAGTTIWVAMLALAVWVLSKAHWSIDWTFSEAKTPLSAGASLTAILGAVFLTTAYMAGPMLNFADFTRLAPNRESVRRGNALGLLVNGVAFCVISVVIALASQKAYGVAVTDPVELLRHMDSIAVLIVAILAIAIATVGINIILNFVSPAYDFSNVAPKHISFRVGGLITAILALVVMPWKLYANPIAVNYFIGGVGALMGPLLGIVLVDYYLVRRGSVDVNSLYTEDTDGEYYYEKGFNQKSIISLVVAGIAAVLVAYLPALSSLAHFSWPIGVIIGGGMCYLLNHDVIQSAGGTRAQAGAPDATKEPTME